MVNEVKHSLRGQGACQKCRPMLHELQSSLSLAVYCIAFAPHATSSLIREKTSAEKLSTRGCERVSPLTDAQLSAAFHEALNLRVPKSGDLFPEALLAAKASNVISTANSLSVLRALVLRLLVGLIGSMLRILGTTAMSRS